MDAIRLNINSQKSLTNRQTFQGGSGALVSFSKRVQKLIYLQTHLKHRIYSADPKRRLQIGTHECPVNPSRLRNFSGSKKSTQSADFLQSVHLQFITISKSSDGEKSESHSSMHLTKSCTSWKANDWALSGHRVHQGFTKFGWVQSSVDCPR